MKHVKILLENEHLEGLLIKEDDKHLALKLSNGYNIGISKNRIKKIEDINSREDLVKEQHSERVHKEIVQHVSKDAVSDLPKVLILHTGGTIASKVDYQTGAVTPKFTPEELNSMFPEIKDIANIESRLFRNMASDDMRFSHYNLIAKEIEKELTEHKDLKGIIITQGTDTIHYTSAALSFIFEHLQIPVVIVGSQRSSDRGSSDAAMNLISAVAFIANTSLKGVFICFHENISDESCIILNGLNAKKLHSSRRDAFKPVNVPSIARIDYNTKNIEYVSEHPESSLNSPGKLKLHLFNEDLKIGMLVSHPNMFAAEIEPFLKGFDGIILQGTGLCHFPINEIDEFTKEHTKIKDVLTELSSKIPVVMSLQTVYGSVNMNVYRPGKALIEMGIIGNYSSLITETSFIKLSWLLSQKLDPKEYFMKDLRGEFLVKSVE
jgi:glutamyl-tRNA(Gln) amidotransferase subunit D